MLTIKVTLSKYMAIDSDCDCDLVEVEEVLPAEYVVCWAGEGGADHDIALTESDINGLIRAKAAIYAGFEVLCRSVGVNLADVEQILIGGAFGQYINIEKAIRIGLLPDGGSTWFLPRLVGDQRARALAMLAPQITAQQAKDWGLIWEVVEDAELMSTATGIARKLADGPTLALGRIKEALNRSSGNDLSAQLDVERDFQRELGRSEDFKEGVMAFLGKRKAEFKGK